MVYRYTRKKEKKVTSDNAVRDQKPTMIGKIFLVIPIEGMNKIAKTQEKVQLMSSTS